eukprot:Seg30.3 transcript_id=Seg30.3/GoldUCD/mRNA.D3Y31 product="Cyclin-dependent kinase inhibitor 1B" protein_id=Seg30.3/GoldUCD/D3Y31
MVTTKGCENQDILELRSRSVTRNVCRSLWNVDHDQVQKDLETERKSLNKQMSQKYNYDFEADKPLNGKWEWTKDAEKLERPLTSRPGPKQPATKRRRGRQPPIEQHDETQPKIANTDARKASSCNQTKKVKPVKPRRTNSTKRKSKR